MILAAVDYFRGDFLGVTKAHANAVVDSIRRADASFFNGVIDSIQHADSLRLATMVSDTGDTSLGSGLLFGLLLGGGAAVFFTRMWAERRLKRLQKIA